MRSSKSSVALPWAADETFHMRDGHCLDRIQRASQSGHGRPRRSSPGHLGRSRRSHIPPALLLTSRREWRSWNRPARSHLLLRRQIGEQLDRTIAGLRPIRAQSPRSGPGRPTRSHGTARANSRAVTRPMLSGPDQTHLVLHGRQNRFHVVLSRSSDGCITLLAGLGRPRIEYKTILCLVGPT